MKRILALLLLMSASVKANDLHDAWMNFGGDSRVASGVKAFVVGVACYEAARVTGEQVQEAAKVFNSNDPWFGHNNHRVEKFDRFVRHLVASGAMGYTTFILGYHYLPAHLKHALNVR